MTDEVGCQGINSKHKVIEPQDLDHGDHAYMAWVERVDCFKLHSHFKLMRARSSSCRILKTNTILGSERLVLEKHLPS